MSRVRGALEEGGGAGSEGEKNQAVKKWVPDTKSPVQRSDSAPVGVRGHMENREL